MKTNSIWILIFIVTIIELKSLPSVAQDPDHPSKELHFPGEVVTAEKPSDGPRGSMRGEGQGASRNTNKGTSSKPSTAKPSLPLKLSTPTQTALQKINHISKSIATIKGFLIGTQLVKLFTDDWKELTIDIYNGIKDQDWKNLATAFKNLGDIEYSQIQQEVTAVREQVENLATELSSQGKKEEASQVRAEVNFWYEFDRSLNNKESEGSQTKSEGSQTKSEGSQMKSERSLNTQPVNASIQARNMRNDVVIDGSITADTAFEGSDFEIIPSFQIRNAQAKNILITAYFHRDKEEPLDSPLLDMNHKYYSTDGVVATGIQIEDITDDDVVFNGGEASRRDFLTIPVEEFHCQPGEEVSFFVAVYVYHHGIKRSKLLSFKVPNYNFPYKSKTP